MKSGTQKLKKFLAFVMTAVMMLTAVPLGGLTFSASAENDGYYTYTVENGEATITDCDETISGDVVIPDTLGGYPVTSIGGWAFYHCTGLTSITIPDSVTSIGGYAFWGCGGLTSITIPDSVTSIGYSAFEDCTGITSITIGNSVTSIGDQAFSGCTGLTSITIPDSVTSIGDSAFSDCTGLTSITIPNGVTSIGDGAFAYCSGLTSITIPDSVKSIGRFAFSGCAGLTSITVSSGNKVYHSTDNCLIETESKTLISGCKNSIIPSDGSVTSIGAGAFGGCTGLTSITIPDSVTSIGDVAFAICTDLTSITIPASVTDIGYYAFGYYQDESTFEVKKVENFTIYGYTGTAAETYANENGFAFIALDEEHTHNFGEWAVTTEPTCTAEGEETRTCSVCGAAETKTISATGHNDSNSDGICDSCGEDLGTHTPSANCSCACHKKGIAKLFFKIKLFFQKIFKKNRVCKCGVNHY